VAFYFYFANAAYANPTIPNTLGVAHPEMNFPPGFPPAIPMMSFYNTNLINVQTTYVPPASDVDVDIGYEFGNPHAIGKCEELIHELAIVLDKN